MRLSLFAAALLAALEAALPARAAGSLLGDPSVAFSADRALTVDGRADDGKIFVRPGAQRHIQAIGGIDQVVILHPREAKGWLVLPRLNSYVEFGFAPALPELSDPSLLSTKVGSETIDGKPTTKYRVEHTARDGTLVEGYLWLTREGIPMRLDGTFTSGRGGRATPVHMELSHVQQGPQDAGLFEVPQNMMKLPTGALNNLLGVGGAS
jgi:hypothetical protein